MFAFRSNTIYLVGDCRSLVSLYDIVRYRQNIQDCDLVSLGNNNIGGNPLTDPGFLGKINHICKTRNIRLYIIRGSHDDPSFWNRGYNFSNLYLTSDYTDAVFPNGISVLFVGGGISINRMCHTEGIDCWKGENTIYRKTDCPFNVLLSHDAPSYFNISLDSLWSSKYVSWIIQDENLLEDLSKQRKIIDRIVENIEPMYIFSGCYDNNSKEEHNKINYQCVASKELFVLNASQLQC